MKVQRMQAVVASSCRTAGLRRRSVMTFRQQIQLIADHLNHRGRASAIFQQLGRVEFFSPRYGDGGVIVQFRSRSAICETWYPTVGAPGRAIGRREGLYGSR